MHAILFGKTGSSVFPNEIRTNAMGWRDVVLRCPLSLAAMMTAIEYYRHVRDVFRQNGNPDVAQGQMAYMRHQFEFFGLKMPAWMGLTKQIHHEKGLPDRQILYELVRLCFEDEHREMHYFGLETLQKHLKFLSPETIEFLEELILTRSWWDTVDWLNKLVGIHFKRFPELIQPITDKWMASGNIWLQRVCMIFQLPYRERTDTELMFRYIRQVAGSKEFFLQKGAGWALRQYAKTDPEAVLRFVEDNRLAPLSRREALKGIAKRREP